MSQVTFLGLSVMDFKASVGWGPNQTSTLMVQLVQDVTNGDVPAPPPLGTPVFFDFFDFTFNGLLQKFAVLKSQSGDPTYQALVFDPREVLEGTQVVIGNYTGDVGPVSNLLNPFGWWENNFGYGSSQANDSGMPWDLVVQALGALCNSPGQGEFGGPLTFAGFTYGLDLSQLPVPDPGYRIGGTAVGLLDAIAAVCEDGGCDFFVELDGFTIVVRTVSRLRQPPLGTIAAVVEANAGNVLRSEDGLEVRNEITSAFLVGGAVCELHQVDRAGIQSFWGYDPDGNPIVGAAGTWKFFDKNGNLLTSVPVENVTLNADGVQDIVGAATYQCSTLEMRLAMVNYESWAAFITSQRPEIAKFITSPFQDMQWAGFTPLKPDFVNDQTKLFGMQALSDTYWNNAQRLHQFVQSYGNDFYGKKFLVNTPFVLTKQDPETLAYTFTTQPTDGGWVPEVVPSGDFLFGPFPSGTGPLGLDALNEDVFKLGDGRFRAFVAFEDVTGVDTGRVSAEDSVVQGTTLYLRANVEQQLVFPSGQQPAALLTLGSAVYKEAADAFGGKDIFGGVFARTEDQGQTLMNASFGDIGVRVSPPALYPSAASVPLRSNVLTYGPWFVAGAPGKVKYDEDQTLVPWNYGDDATMQAAGSARVLNAVTNMQVSEEGLLELVGPPAASLGDILREGGPNLTNIDVSFGKDGVTTSYRFQTFTPRFGVFSKNVADRMKKMGLTAMELRKAVRAKVNNAISDAQAAQDVAARGFMGQAPKAIKRASPHEALICHSEQDAGGLWRVCPKALTYEEAVGLDRADDDDGFSRTAVMSMDGLLRPFSTGGVAASGMPVWTTPTLSNGGLSANGLTPFPSGNDITFLAWGTACSGLNSYRMGNDPLNTRALALRGPVVIAGWGWDIFSNPVPGSGTVFYPNALRRCDLWKVGPLDVLWDQPRGCWTAHDVRRGVLAGQASPSGFAAMNVAVNGGSGYQLNVYNPWGTTAASGATVMASFVPDFMRFELLGGLSQGGNGNGSLTAVTSVCPIFSTITISGSGVQVMTGVNVEYTTFQAG